MSVLLFLLAVLPGLLLCYFIFAMDKYEKEPQSILLICFILGVIATFPAIQMEEIGQHYVSKNEKAFLKIFVFATFVVGFSEEILKFLSLMLFAYPKKVFNEPMDGIVYSMMIGMRFATAENILYANNFGFSVVIARAFTAVPAHAVFAVLMGYHIGKAKFEQNFFKKCLLIITGFSTALLAHGVYDFLLLQEKYEALMMLATISIVLGAVYGKLLILKQQRTSPFRDDHHEELTTIELAQSDRLRFVQDEGIIGLLLARMKPKDEVLPENWGQIYVDSYSGDKWLLFNTIDNFTEMTNPRMVHMPGPSPTEVVNLVFSAEYDDEIIAAAEYLRLIEHYDGRKFREKLLTHLVEFDAENLSDLHRERIILLILETKLNNEHISACAPAVANKAHDLLGQLS